MSRVEDEHADLHELVQTLKGRNKVLEDEVIDMETRSRLNNLRLVGVPEDAEGSDPCSFLEQWIPEPPPLQSPLVMEGAHRAGPKQIVFTAVSFVLHMSLRQSCLDSNI